MTLTIGNKLAGFTVKNAVEVPVLSGTLYQLEHDKTGAELIWIDRPDVNKTFCVGFQTVPEDDTGVFHIIEHSVLCGSEKYPVKDPFVELLKGSLNTFLNAMTFPDKTIYPVSSRNDKDFYNLMRVYLDAVFFPNIYHNPNIFRQEGWHYELDESGEVNRVGVVYGEMKGAFSSPDELFYTKMNRMLYPDTTYGFCSGGDPEHIPELTYEHFVASHRRFYHPTNAKIVLDGSVDLEAALKVIDGEYLSRFDRGVKTPLIPLQKPISGAEMTVDYEISPDDDKTAKANFGIGKIVSSWEDIERTTALQVLIDAIAGSNTAPITRAVLEQGLGEDLQVEIEDGLAQPTMYLQVRNCREEQLPGMKAALQAIFRKVLSDGLDKSELTASLNRLEFESRERKEPLGIILAIRAADSWLYGGNPAQKLDLADVFASLREKLDSSYYADLLEDVFLNDDGMAILNMLPSNTLGAEKAAASQAKLNEIAGNWGEAEKEQIRREQKELAAWQQESDTAEALAKIPHLNRSDLSPEPLWTDCPEELLGAVRVLRPQISTPGTVYLNLYFALPPISVDRLPAVSLLTELLGKLPTKKSSRELLQREVKTWLGNLDFSVVPISKANDPDHAVCYLLATCSVLEQNADHAISLLREILLETELNHPEAIREIVRQCWLDAQQAIVRGGNRYAFQHALSKSSAESAATDAVNGYGIYRYLRVMTEQFDSEAILRDIEPIMQKLASLPLTLAVTGNLDPERIEALIFGMGGKEVGPTITVQEPKIVRDAISIPAGVAYAATGGNLNRFDAAYHGSFALAAKILSLNYLWNEVSVQGGAYGSGMGVSPFGMLFCYSYRDPNPARTMRIYRGCAEYLRGFCKRGESFDQLMIGTVSDSEPVLSPDRMSRATAETVLRGVTLSQKRIRRAELLHATYDDLLRYCDLLDRVFEQANVCVIGGDNLLDACADDAGNRIR